MNAELSLSDSTLERLPPQSLEAEQAVLGALLVSGDGVSRVVDLLDPEYFYRKAHQVIYAAMLDLYEENEPIDIVTVSQYLKDEGKLENVGGRQYITDLSLSVATTANLEYYAKVVQEKAILRQLIKAGTEIVGSCYEETDADMALDRAEHMIFTLAQRRELQQLVHIKHIVEDSFQKIEERYENREALSGVPSGFYDLDALTSGFQPSDLVIIAARPSMGKCLSYDSEIVLSDGSIATIQEIYRARYAELLTLGNDYRLRFARPTLFLDDGVKPVYKVTTRLGRSVETTLAHPFLTLSGWQRLEKLKVGNKIALPNRIPIFGTARMSEFDVKLLALLTSEGCIREGKLSIAAAKQPVLASLVRKTGGTTAGALEERPSPMSRLMENNLPKQRNESISVPSIVFTLERRQVAVYLNMLYMAHGWIVRQVDGGSRVCFATLSIRLARQIQHLLLRFGIIASLGESKTADGVPTNLLEISDAQSVDRFEKNIHEYLEDEEIPAIRRGMETDLFWDEIVSIESMGMKQVYDLTIPQTHNFVANDICVHNTAFVLNIAQNVAVEHNIPVAIFSLEMSKESLVMRMLCSEAEIDAGRLRSGHMHTTDWTKLASAMGRLGESPVYIDDSALVNALEIRAKCRRLKAEMGGLGLVVIDYIQLMQGRKATDNRVQEVSEISRSLKQLAREINVPVLALSQLSRAVEARQNKRPMLSDLRESGCLAGDTLVFLPDCGTYARIDSLVGKTGFNVLAMNQQTLKLEPRTVTNAFCTGVKPTFKLTTRLNKTIKATANHKFRTIDGWKRLDELNTGDKLALPRKIFANSKSTMSKAELGLLGYLIGDGCTLAGHAIQYTTADLDLAEDVVNRAKRVFGDQIVPRIKRERDWYQVYLSSARRLTHGIRNAISQWLDELGAFDLRSHEKLVPEKVFAQADEDVSEFLRHLWSTDGCVAISSGIPRIFYASSSERLARGIQSLLLRFEITARIVRVAQRGKGRDQYYVSISGRDDQLRFVQSIGVHDARRQSTINAIFTHLTSVVGNTNRDVIPIEAWRSIVEPARIEGGLTTRVFQKALSRSYSGSTLYKSSMSRQRAARVGIVLDSPLLLALAESDLYWDEIVSIESDEDTPVYDLTVDEQHNFVANDIVVHNSIEQDADLVMFIYRDEYYNQESDRRGEAEIIIAKQRNGPTGTVDLLYQGAITRFLNKVHSQYTQV